MNYVNELFGIPLVISLKRRPDRRERFVAWAKEQDFNFNFIDAVDGQAFLGQQYVTASMLGLNKVIENGYYGPNFQFMFSNECSNDFAVRARGAGLKRRCGMLACRLSHLEAIQHSNFIMEDDAVARKDVASAARLLGKIPKFDALFLGTGMLTASVDFETHPENESFEILHRISRAHAYVISDVGKRLLTKYWLNHNTFVNPDTPLTSAGFCKEAVVLRTTTTLFRQQDITESDVQNAGEKPEQVEELRFF